MQRPSRRRLMMHLWKTTSALLFVLATSRGGPVAVSSSRGGQARELQEAPSAEADDSTAVRREAFDATGESLGYASDASASWAEAEIRQSSLYGEEQYMYHDNASYYIVGTGDGTIVELWHAFEEGHGGKEMASIHLSAAAKVVLESRDDTGADTFRVKVVNAGLAEISEVSMCAGDGCPALVLTETSQLAYRYANGEALSLTGHLEKWSLENGWSFTDDFIKFYSYDLQYDGDWLGIPLISDTRVLAYNKTTFEAHGIDAPPGKDSGYRWEWQEFVETAQQLTVATGKPGWYFKGGYDEETKLSLMIARNWAATLYKNDEDNVMYCSLGENFVAAMNSTIEKMLLEGWMSPDFIPIDTTNFDTWVDMGADTAQAYIPVTLEENEHCCVYPSFPSNSSELLGMTIVSPGVLSEVLGDDIEEAFVPGRHSYLGGSGLFISEAISQAKQAYAWELMKEMVGKASMYALVQGSPPPFESVLKSEALWSTEKWALPMEQLRASVPSQYPELGFAQFQALEMLKPFRTMWMEMYYKDIGSEEASELLASRVDKILKVVCTWENYSHESCRRCEKGDYNHTFSSCDPSTQTLLVSFSYDPQDTLCFGGVDPPNSTLLECDHVEVSSGFGIVIILVSCLGGLLALVAAVLVYVYRDQPVIKLSQPKFCALFSLGVAGLCLSNLALVGANTSGSCLSRMVVWGFAFDLGFGALFSKVYRVQRVFRNATNGRRRRGRPFIPLYTVISLAVVLDAIVLTLWSIFDEHGPVEKNVLVGDTGIVAEMSSCHDEYCFWAISFYTFKILLIVWGVYLAWATRKINYALVEGREISWSIYLFGVLAAILILIGSAGLRIEFWALAKTFVFCLSSCTALVMVLVPKLWAAHKKLAVDMSLLASTVSESLTTRRLPETRGTENVIDGDGDGDGIDANPSKAPVCAHCQQQKLEGDENGRDPYHRVVRSPPNRLSSSSEGGGLRLSRRVRGNHSVAQCLDLPHSLNEDREGIADTTEIHQEKKRKGRTYDIPATPIPSSGDHQLYAVGSEFTPSPSALVAGKEATDTPFERSVEGEDVMTTRNPPPLTARTTPRFARENVVLSESKTPISLDELSTSFSSIDNRRSGAKFRSGADHESDGDCRQSEGDDSPSNIPTSSTSASFQRKNADRVSRDGLVGSGDGVERQQQPLGFGFENNAERNASEFNVPSSSREEVATFATAATGNTGNIYNGGKGIPTPTSSHGSGISKRLGCFPPLAVFQGATERGLANSRSKNTASGSLCVGCSPAGPEIFQEVDAELEVTGVSSDGAVPDITGVTQGNRRRPYSEASKREPMSFTRLLQGQVSALRSAFWGAPANELNDSSLQQQRQSGADRWSLFGGFRRGLDLLPPSRDKVLPSPDSASQASISSISRTATQQPASCAAFRSTTENEDPSGDPGNSLSGSNRQNSSRVAKTNTAGEAEILETGITSYPPSEEMEGGREPASPGRWEGSAAPDTMYFARSGVGSGALPSNVGGQSQPKDDNKISTRIQPTGRLIDDGADSDLAPPELSVGRSRGSFVWHDVTASSSIDMTSSITFSESMATSSSREPAGSGVLTNEMANPRAPPMLNLSDVDSRQKLQAAINPNRVWTPLSAKTGDKKHDGRQLRPSQGQRSFSATGFTTFSRDSPSDAIPAHPSKPVVLVAPLAKSIFGGNIAPSASSISTAQNSWTPGRQEVDGDGSEYRQAPPYSSVSVSSFSSATTGRSGGGLRNGIRVSDFSFSSVGSDKADDLPPSLALAENARKQKNISLNDHVFWSESSDQALTRLRARPSSISVSDFSSEGSSRIEQSMTASAHYDVASAQRHRLPSAVDPNRVWTPRPKNAAGGRQDQSQRQFNFSASDFSSGFSEGTEG